MRKITVLCEPCTLVIKEKISRPLRTTKHSRGESIKSTSHVFSQMVMVKSYFFLDASGTGLKWHPLVFYTVAEKSHREFTPHLQNLLIPGHSKPHGKTVGIHMTEHIFHLTYVV